MHKHASDPKHYSHRTFQLIPTRYIDTHMTHCTVNPFMTRWQADKEAPYAVSKQRCTPSVMCSTPAGVRATWYSSSYSQTPVPCSLYPIISLNMSDSRARALQRLTNPSLSRKLGHIVSVHWSLHFSSTNLIGTLHPYIKPPAVSQQVRKRCDDARQHSFANHSTIAPAAQI